MSATTGAPAADVDLRLYARNNEELARATTDANGRASFAAAFSVTAFSALISFAVGGLVRALLVRAKGSVTEVSTGLGILAAERGFYDPLRSLLDMADALLARETLDAEQVTRLAAGLPIDDPSPAAGAADPSPTPTREGGWKTLALVERYSHLSPSHKAEAVERLTQKFPDAIHDTDACGEEKAAVSN